MASIPANGYNAVMAGTNTYTGSNYYANICPQTPIAPVAPTDLCNKTYVDGTSGGVGNLTQVLTAGNSASGIAMTAVGNIGCADIQAPFGSINAFNSTTIQDIGGTGTAVLPVGTLKLKGCQTKGSILAGDGTSSAELTVGANNFVLTADNTTATGLKWAASSGGVASVSAGSNITVSGTATNPIVGVSSPLTSTLDIGTQIVSSTSTGNINFDNTITKANLSSGMLRLQDSTNAGINTSITRSLVSIIDSTISSGTLLTTDTLSQIGTVPLNINPAAGTDLNMNVSGVGRVHIIQSGTGGDTQPAISIENNNGNANGIHIDMYKNSASPAASDTLGGISFHGNSSTGVKREYASIDAILEDPTNASENGSISLAVCQNSSTPAEYFRCNGLTGTNQIYKNLDVRSFQITSSNSDINIQQPNAARNISLTNNGNGGSIFLTANVGATSDINLNASRLVSITGNTGISLGAGVTTGVSVVNSLGTKSQLRTSITAGVINQEPIYNPTVVVENLNTNNITVDQPRILGQTLTLVNKGVTPLIGWQDVGSPIGPFDSMYLAAGGYVWLGIGPNIVITDTNFSTIYQTITLQGSGSTIKCLCFYEAAPYMYIGGSFDSVDFNATPQYGLSRIYTSTPVGFYSVDPMYDSMNGIYGITASSGEVYTINMYGGVLYVGGNFTNLSNGNPGAYGFQVINPGGSSGTSTYDNAGGLIGFNAKVWSIVSSGNYVFWGGEYTSVASGANAFQFCAAYDPVSLSWTTCDSNNFNSPVYALGVSVISANILVGGSFSQSGYSGICYIDYINPNSSINAGISPGVLGPNCIYCGSGVDLVANTSSDNWRSSSITAWQSLGASFSGAPSGIFQYGTVVFNSFNTYSWVRQTYNQTQAVTYTLAGAQFANNGAYYSSYTLPTSFTAQQFVGDPATNSYYYCIGSPLGTFS